jgi:hypothetical protein
MGIGGAMQTLGWAKRSSFEYDVPNYDRLPDPALKELHARQFLHQLVEYFHVEPETATVDDDGCEVIPVIAFLPVSLFNWLVTFDVDGDADLETQDEDEGATCEDEGAQCDDEGVQI